MRNILLYFILMKSIEGKPPLRAIGGKDAASDEYPYVVRIEIYLPNTNSASSLAARIHPLCTGSLLTPVWTLSAAHCFRNIQIKNNTITVGTSKEPSNEPKTLVIGRGPINNLSSYASTFSKVDYFINHHSFRLLQTKVNVKPMNDIALVHHQRIYLKAYGKVAGLDFISLIGHEVTLAGYGVTHDSEGELSHTFLLKKPVQVFTGVVIQCPPDIFLYPAQCVTRQCGQVISNTCSGDSGGPVIHPAGIVGVISKSKTCFPLQYAVPMDIVAYNTPISPYINWISDHVGRIQ